MKTLLEGFGIHQCVAPVIAMLVSMQAWSGPVGPGGRDTPSAARASSSSMNRGAEVAPMLHAARMPNPGYMARPMENGLPNGCNGQRLARLARMP